MNADRIAEKTLEEFSRLTKDLSVHEWMEATEHLLSMVESEYEAAKEEHHRELDQ